MAFNCTSIGHFNYSYVYITWCIHYSRRLQLEYFVIGNSPPWFSLFFIHFVKQQKVAKASFHTVHRVVRKKLNFGLRVCRICSCVMIIKIKMLCITEIHCLPQGTPFFNPHIYILLSLTLLKYNQKWLEWNYTVVIGYICCFPKNQNILKSILTVFGWIQNLPHLSFNFMN